MTSRNAGWAFAMAVLLGTVSLGHADESKTTDPSGTWRWEHEEGGETVKDVLKLTYDGKKVSGTYQGRVGPLPIKDAKIDGDKLGFHFTVDLDGQKIKVAFAGKIKGDQVEGQVDISANGEAQKFPWKATRSVQAADVVGLWNLKIELNDGNTLTPSVKFTLDDTKKLRGEYTSKSANAKLPVKGLKIKDGKLVFTISGEFDGNQLTAHYAVQPRGDRLSGMLEYDYNGNTGELDVSGTRQAAAAKKPK